MCSFHIYISYQIIVNWPTPRSPICTTVPLRARAQSGAPIAINDSEREPYTAPKGELDYRN